MSPSTAPPPAPGRPAAVARRLARGGLVLAALAIAGVLAVRPRGEGVEGAREEGAPAAAARAPALAAGARPEPFDASDPARPSGGAGRATVRGRVLAPDGAPRAGVTVTLHRAAEGGRYFAAATRTSAARTVLGPAGSGGEAVPVPAWLERRAALTRDDGAYAFEGVEPEGFVEVVARRRDAFVASAKRALSPDAGDVVVDLVLRERPAVAVRLRTSDGAPLRGGRHDLLVRRAYDDGEEAPFGWTLTRDDGRDRSSALEIVRSRAGGPSWVTIRVSAVASDDGAVEWRLPQGGLYRLAVFVPGHRAFVTDGMATPDDPPRDLGEVRLEPAGDAGRVRLVDGGGRPLADRAISLATADEFQTPVLGPEPDGSRRTDRDGWLSLEHVVEGEAYHVWLDDPEAGRSLPLRVTARLVRGGTVRFAEP